MAIPEEGGRAASLVNPGVVQPSLFFVDLSDT
jgi:hypothetical protein